MSLDAMRDLWRAARDSGFYPADDLALMASRVPAGDWPPSDLQFLVADAQAQVRWARECMPVRTQGHGDV